MKLQFKQQKFQADAAKAVVDVFAGQPYATPTYLIDKGDGVYQTSLLDDSTGSKNQPIVLNLTDEIILKNLNTVQRNNLVEPSEKLEKTEKIVNERGDKGQSYNLTIEMETGVGKTYTYIKTMYELNKHYGWSKFIVVVPSIAIREGVYKTFCVTQEHFAEEYGRKIRFFIYNSAQLTELDRFASDSSINVMIINSQAFNARGEAARRIYMRLDEFRSRRPIDIIAKTNPILIIDEPQSVEGATTKENLKKFNPLMTLRYSATHRSDSIYNMVYRLDAMDAYNKRLVKKIAVKGISQSGMSTTGGYVYLAGINLSKKAPTATIEFQQKGASGVKLVMRNVSEGYNLYANSGDMEEYKDGYTVMHIDGRDNSVEFSNGLKLFAGELIGNAEEDMLRRIQIRETILSHIERERELFYKGIKVLSLFFIDKVENYRVYDDAGNPQNGEYAKMFEEEYAEIVNHFEQRFGEELYVKYLNELSAAKTHAGYFSVDNKGRIKDSKIKRGETSSDDVSAYDLIMKNKELLLERDPKKSPVRFIFSHSALKEGWDNPNVFQICTLKQSGSEVRKRQEVGRGMRLCVNEKGDRMDENVLGGDVHEVNLLTVIASESYDSFVRGLQSELAEAVAFRPRKVDEALFVGRVLHDDKGEVLYDENGFEAKFDTELAQSIIYDLTINKYIDKKHTLTDKFYEDKANGNITLDEELVPYKSDIVALLDGIYNEALMKPDNAHDNDVTLELQENKLKMTAFKELWERINSKSAYVVDFDTDELIKKSIAALDKNLRVPEIYFKVDYGVMEDIKSKDDLLSGGGFMTTESDTFAAKGYKVGRGVKYDLVGKLVEATGLTRKAVVAILTGIRADTFDKFKANPEEFIIRSARLINSEKATAIVEHIAYNVLDDKYETKIFTDTTIKGKLNVNVMETKKHLFDHVVYDSANERKFAQELDQSAKVAVYVKLPKGFFISTPVGKYNPDWAIAFEKDTVKHIYFVAETKGSLDTLELREIEKAKIHCAEKHFKALGAAIKGDKVVYEKVDDYQTLLNIVKVQ